MKIQDAYGSRGKHARKQKPAKKKHFQVRYISVSMYAFVHLSQWDFKSTDFASIMFLQTWKGLSRKYSTL